MNQNKNIVLTIVASMLLVIGVFVNDPFGWFDESYQTSDPLMEKLNVDSVEKITISRGSKSSLVFTKTNEDWFVSVGKGTSAKANKSDIEKNLLKFSTMRKYNEVTSSKEKYTQFEVGDDDFNIEIMGSNNIIIAKLFLGKKGSGTATTLVRLDKEEEVYSVNGTFRSDWDKSFNQFRDRTILNFNKENVESLKFNGKQSYTINRDKAGWKIKTFGVSKPGNPSTIDPIVSSLSTLVGSSFDIKNPNLIRFGTVEVTLSSKVNLKLEIFGPGLGKTYIAKSSMLADLISIPEYKVNALFKDSKGLIQKAAPAPAPKKK